MHRYPIRVGVLLALTLCANPAARAAGAGAYPAPDYRGQAYGQAGSVPGGGRQSSGYSAPAYGQPAPGFASGGGQQSYGHSGPVYGQPGTGSAPGGGYQAPGYSGPAYGGNGVPGAYAQGGSAPGQQGGGTAGGAGLGYGYAPLNSAFQGGYGPGSGQASGPGGDDRAQQTPRRSGGNRFNSTKTMPDPMNSLRGNRGH